MSRVKHNPRCAIFNEPPGLQSASDCNCGAIPNLPKPDHYASVHDAVLAMLEYGESFESVDDAVAAAEAAYIKEHPEADR